MTDLPIVIIAAIADNGVIGDDNRLIWRLKTDLRRFRTLTLGRPVIMGRKTFQSIGQPLPGRETVLLTRDPAFAPAGAHIARTLAEAVAIARRIGAEQAADSVVVAGGAQVYAQALPLADRLELTFVHAQPPGDAHFPDWDRRAFRPPETQAHAAGPDDEHAFTFATFHRCS